MEVFVSLPSKVLVQRQQKDGNQDNQTNIPNVGLDIVDSDVTTCFTVNLECDVQEGNGENCDDGGN